MVDEHSAGPDSVGHVVGMLRTLSDPTRLRLLSVLRHGELSVSALCDRLHLAQHCTTSLSVQIYPHKRAVTIGHYYLLPEQS